VIGIYPFSDENWAKITAGSTQGIMLGGLINGKLKLGLRSMVEVPLTSGVLI
jgi:hypothetical protein